MRRTREPGRACKQPRTWALLAFGLGLFAWTPRARAEPPALSLEWQAPETCPQRPAMVAAVGELLPELGPVGAAEDGASMAVHAEIAQSGSDWTIALRIESDAGTDARAFTASSCDALAEAAALMIAVSLDPVAARAGVVPVARDDAAPRVILRPRSTTAPETAEPPPTPSPPEPTPDPSPVEGPREPEFPARAPSELFAPTGPSPRTLSLRDLEDAGPSGPVLGILGVQVGGGLGPMGLSQFAMGFDLGATGRSWRADLRGTYFAPRTEAVSGADGAVARYDALIASVRGCGVPTLRGGALEFPLCLGFAGGGLRAEGIGPTPGARRAWLPWMALVPGVGLRARVGPRVVVGVELELPASLVRGRYSLDDLIVRDIAPVGLSALLGFELRLGAKKSRRARQEPAANRP